MVTVLPRGRVEACSRPRPTSVLKVEPLVLPCTDSVWVRVAQAAGGGSFSTTRLTVVAAPRSTCTHCGNALLALSQ